MTIPDIETKIYRATSLGYTTEIEGFTKARTGIVYRLLHSEEPGFGLEQMRQNRLVHGEEIYSRVKQGDKDGNR